ncbi:peptidase S8/S53 domain-containing protein [Schizophyllum amplum]|uniref:tripeptidyl-peptidase II n=1 Tax=Schizophyllum amplum TaxID=97359 RepID=A0A550CP35_9AGAR|nr:peptidase S8/S53 domain-containing protein [Auriculariopsis ampla]
MRFSFSSAILASAVLRVLGSPAPRAAMRLHEKRKELPSGFVNKGAAAADTMIDMRIALKMADRDGLEAALFDVSTPSSANYGKHLTQDEVKAYASPSAETSSAVSDWLSGEGITFDIGGSYDNWVTFSVPVSKANELLDASYETFLHTPTDSSQVRTLAYSLPEALTGHVDAVYPTTSIVKPRIPGPVRVFAAPPSLVADVNVTADAVPASCNSTVTPTCLQALYGIPATPATQSSNHLGVSGYIRQYAQESDLALFLSLLREDISSNTSFTLETLDGGSNPQGASYAGIEANLDIQYTVGVATGVPVYFISVGGNNQDSIAGFIDIVDYLEAEDAPPQVLTTSYGYDENDLGSSLATRFCDSYMTLGARGVSVLFASGDGGVSGLQSQSCSTFQPTFPATCPYITAVGGTVNVPETAVDFSSGGFSQYFNRTDYQADVVEAYLDTLGSTNQGLYVPTGRAFPDVAAMGDNIEIVHQGQTGLIGGTSASSPIFASVISLINDQLIAAGKSPLGFLNPWVYENPQAFNDITTGSNPGCNTDGFPAVAGWDPVTGLGTPNFSQMLAAAGL